MKSKVLLTTSFRWFTTARLAMAFSNSGLSVEAVCPSKHPLAAIGASCSRQHHYHALTPISSLLSAIRAAQPDLIIACDDVAATHLRQLHQITSVSARRSLVTVRELLERSLGDPRGFPVQLSRYELLSLAAREGIATPLTKVVASEEEAAEQFRQLGVPAVMKADGTSGGEGVRLAYDVAQARSAYRVLRSPVCAAVAAKHALVDYDMNLVMPWLLRRKRDVTIQSYVSGRDANIAVACWQGSVVASISVEVLRSKRDGGPSVVVRLLHDRRLLNVAETLVRKLGISGLCGFDFILSQRSGEPCLIELNPRATQTCHLPLGPGHDLPRALSAALSGSPIAVPDALTENDTIAFFPSAWRENPSDDALKSAYHDVPWEAPDLVRLGAAKESHLTLEAWGRLRSKSRFAAPPSPSHPIPVLKERGDV